MNLTGKIALFIAGTLFGSAGLKILGSKDARKVYTQVTAAVLRASTPYAVPAGYAYDLAGNRVFSSGAGGIGKTWTANALNQYTTIPRPSGPPRSPLYDADGNLVNDRTLTYTYDAENRLVSATALSMKLSICHSPVQPQTLKRKLRSISLPCSVWFTSGWNCTP